MLAALRRALAKKGPAGLFQLGLFSMIRMFEEMKLRSSTAGRRKST
jgi:hypothetical protein